jgi:3-hydroxyacyl-[acyl-carrier-protein] dehydratase
MLMNDFFKITDLRSGDTHIAQIALNPSHKVYEGHFPGMPVAPGVCLVQMTKEILESITGKKLLMESCSNIKFTAILNPFVNPDVTLTLEHTAQDHGLHHAACSLAHGETKFLSLKGQYREI